MDVYVLDACSLIAFFEKEPGRLKSVYRISLADALALAEAKTRNAPLVTSDHHEFDDVEKSKEVRFFWIR